jgi:8-oxo-dGTP pyrophosphatase MutT (NUDIX family)
MPGGGIDAGEQPVDAAVRETAEETSIRVSPSSVKPIGVFREHDFVIHLFKAPAPSVAARLTDGEHDRFAWITPREVSCYRTLPLVKEAARHA